MIFNLQKEIENLHETGSGADGVHRASLHRNDGAIYVLLAMGENSHMREHQAKAFVSVQCVEGEILFILEGQEHLLHSGDIIMMEPGERHSLTAKIKSAALVTLAKSAV